MPETTTDLSDLTRTVRDAAQAVTEAPGPLGDYVAALVASARQLADRVDATSVTR